MNCWYGLDSVEFELCHCLVYLCTIYTYTYVGRLFTSHPSIYHSIFQQLNPIYTRLKLPQTMAIGIQQLFYIPEMSALKSKIKFLRNHSTNVYLSASLPILIDIFLISF